MVHLGVQSFLFLLVVSLATSAEKAEDLGCPSCVWPTLRTAAAERSLIELVKQHILEKLHLKEKPNITQLLPQASLMTAFRKLHIGKVWKDGMLGRQAQSSETQGYEIISFAETGSSNSSKTELRFHISKDRTQSIQILQANLWLYLRSSKTNKQNATWRIFLSDGRNSSRTLIGEKQTEGTWESWHIFPLTRSVQRFFDRGDKWLNFEVECEVCQWLSGNANESHQPFLAARAQLRKGGHPVHKREVSCDQNSNLCCKKDFYMDFKDIGWNDWIIKPEGYHMNYCMGLCPLHIAGTPGIAASFHTAVFNLIKANNIHTAVNSCCVPTKKRPLSMLYFDRDSNIVKTDIPDMIVEACGCT
ncbi:inhibin beta C chain-like [Latimeria chalumnae]|uniref:TGF-beta family profile domain-containing protein n=1 Tax=Latimeria chalumnae TaxID=7897 RepID=H3BIG4_LATCH|nr:PREDICTED: inhibin beta C chain-like [Latimeria chalumnae]|eukprot:XP_014348699.1 PREDICTED: inhibin beta C chain-like [Latimeria chalumnae]